VSGRVILACGVLPLLVVGARMQVEGRAALRQAAALADRADPEASAARVAALGRAARRLGGPAAEARTELAALGRRGVPGAWDELRASILATRWLVTPAPALLDEAEQALAAQRAVEVLARQGAASPPEPARLAAEQAAQLAWLRTTGEPVRAWSLLAIAGLGLFLVGAARLLGRGRSALALACTGVGVLGLLLGLWRA
jgi:hypothetical protein